MTNEIMKGSIDILLLCILKKEDTYGYEIAKRIKEKSQGGYTMGEGTLYPALKRLEKKGLIEVYWMMTSVKEKRKYYKITEEGRKALEERLVQWERVTNLIQCFKEE